MHTQETHATLTASLYCLHPGLVVRGNAEAGTSTKCDQKGAVGLALNHGGHDDGDRGLDYLQVWPTWHLGDDDGLHKPRFVVTYDNKEAPISSIPVTDEQVEEIGDEFLVGEGALGNVLRKVSECHAPNCGAIPAGVGRSPQSHRRRVT